MVLLVPDVQIQSVMCLPMTQSQASPTSYNYFHLGNFDEMNELIFKKFDLG